MPSVLPKGLRRIRHYGLFANGNRRTNIALARELLAMPPRVTKPETDAPSEPNQPRSTLGAYAISRAKLAPHCSSRFRS